MLVVEAWKSCVFRSGRVVFSKWKGECCAFRGGRVVLLRSVAFEFLCF